MSLLTVGVFLLSTLSCMAANVPRQVRWDELPMVTGKTVSIVMPGGAMITGKATAVESDALVVKVSRTTDGKAYPKGPVRVPRATLHTLELKTKGHKFRVLGTVIGAAGGLAGGVVAAIHVNGILSNKNITQADAALFGILAAGTIAGYLAGNAADGRSVTIQVLP